MLMSVLVLVLAVVEQQPLALDASRAEAAAGPARGAAVGVLERVGLDVLVQQQLVVVVDTAAAAVADAAE